MITSIEHAKSLVDDLAALRRFDQPLVYAVTDNLPRACGDSLPHSTALDWTQRAHRAVRRAAMLAFEEGRATLVQRRVAYEGGERFEYVAVGLR